MNMQMLNSILSTSPHTITTFSKPQFKCISLPTSTTISLLSLFTIPNEARAAISVDQIVTSITLVEQTIDQVQGFLDLAERGLEAIGNFLKSGIDAGLPIVQQAGKEALKFASPAFSEASKKAQEALQSFLLFSLNSIVTFCAQINLITNNNMILISCTNRRFQLQCFYPIC
ncbi:unnamed protein product [Trifolium pratense]|uniref:Uncharacterized protein n=1 Tax=Trifolium pratense TaxID=57577 RepID=A0ACB0IUF1_TRIPR|nr:unnamed protein product [Trifolium pratense]